MRRQTDAQRGGVSGKRQVLQAAGRNHRVDQPVFLFLQRDTGILDGKTAEEVLRLEDRQKINRLRDADGGEAMLEWLRWSEETKEKLPQEALEWVLQEKVSPGRSRRNVAAEI